MEQDILNIIIEEYTDYYDNFGYLFYFLVVNFHDETDKKCYKQLILNPGNRFYIDDLIKKIPDEIKIKFVD